MKITAESIAQLVKKICDAPTPDGTKPVREFTAVRSLAFTPLFAEVFSCKGCCQFELGSEPPDFWFIAGAMRISVEVTSFTTGGLEVYNQERLGCGSYTSTLRAKKPGKQFRIDLKAKRLPDDSEAVPHFENVGDLDRDYYQLASQVLKGKLVNLAKYHGHYTKNVLLVHDKLSEFKSDFERRIPTLRGMLNSIRSHPRFDAIILVDGNHHSGAVAIRL